MKFTDRPKWKIIILAFICSIALIAIAGGSYAAYTSQAHQRGVARNRDNENVRFTSNYLQSCAQGTLESAYAGRTKLFSEDQANKSNLTVEIEIYNYANGNISLVNQKDITYELTIKLSGGDETACSVTSEDGELISLENGEYHFKDQTLTGRTANSKKYTITFPGSDLDKLKITATAIPTNPSATNSQILAAVIAPCTGSTTQTFHAEGKYLDESSDTKPIQYDGFNYEISISSGTANATLTWKKDIVEIDKFFLQKIEKTANDITSSDNVNNTLTFRMNQADGTGDYVIPFYIRNKKTIQGYTDWELMKKDNVIAFKADQITEQQNN